MAGLGKVARRNTQEVSFFSAEDDHGRRSALRESLYQALRVSEGVAVALVSSGVLGTLTKELTIDAFDFTSDNADVPFGETSYVFIDRLDHPWPS